MITLYKHGKVRDIYRFAKEEYLLLVATDRVSAFDRVLDEIIPGKGEVLTEISKYWFKFLGSMGYKIQIPHPEENIPLTEDDLAKLPVDYQRRSMFVHKLPLMPYEMVVRGYLTGSAWTKYKETPAVEGKVDLWGNLVPEGLQENEKFPQAIFTPTTKSEEHDEPVNLQDFLENIGSARGTIGNAIKTMCLRAYKDIADAMYKRGIILVDTKFEMGWEPLPCFVDEIATPDSSRYWSVDDYAAGHPVSLDKQVLRDWLKGQGFTGEGPVPTLTDDIIEEISGRYRRIRNKIIGV